MTMMNGNNRHETFLIVRCSSGTAVVLLTAVGALVSCPAGCGPEPSRKFASQSGQLPYGGLAHQAGALLSNLQPEIRYCIAWASSRAPKAFSRKGDAPPRSAPCRSPPRDRA